MSKLTARERLLVLFDEGSFVENDVYMTQRNLGENAVPGDGVVTGYGTIDGRLVFAFAQDSSVQGGAWGEIHGEKISRMQTRALKDGAPIIGIFDSTGVRIPEGAAGLSGLGKALRNVTLASGVIPQIAIVMGPCVGGAAYLPPLMDYTIMVDQQSHMFMSGPQVVKAVSGKDVSLEELGGAETHSTVSGCAHYAAANEEDALAHAREVLSYLPSHNLEGAPVIFSEDDVNRQLVEWSEIIPENSEAPYDMYDFIRLLVDNDSDYLDVMAGFAPNIITCLVRLEGHVVGVIANQPQYLGGYLDSDACSKAARFIRTCDMFNIPILTLVDVPGFAPDASQERGGLIRQGSKMVYAYAEATVPKLTLILRKAYGSAYTCMASKDMGADIVLAWSGAQVSVMAPQSAAVILYRDEIAAAADPAAAREEFASAYAANYADAIRAAEMGYVDDLIDPAATRQRVIRCFDTMASKRDSLPAKKHGNIPL
ncbi:MAG: acyl-CoA carboxylase subunit beta [Firmicutes bacterium]|nr:acyl-CoA carboxylase subunit beta [Bacillota bacterium]